MSSDFINGLVATAEPVKPRRVGVEVFAVLAVALIEFVGFTYFFDPHILASAYAADPFRMAVKIGLFGLLALAAMGLAILSFNPSAKRIEEGVIVIMAAAIIASLLVFDFSFGSNLNTTFFPAVGIHCAISVTSLSLPVTMALALLMTRGASTQPQRSALLAGLAGGAYGAFLFSLQCPQVTVWYLGLWYGSGIFIASLASAMLIPRFVRW